MCKTLIYWTFVISLLVLAEGQASGAYRAAYWDQRYWTSWADEDVTVAIRDAFQAAGYEILDADELKTWMDARIADRKASVVVFCRDVAPDTVIESLSSDCTLRQYLDAGGKIVWYSDIPVWDLAHLGGGYTYLGPSGCANILGIQGVDWQNSTGTQVVFTDDGVTWGLTETWTSERWTPADQVDLVLATDAAGNAAAWVKHFVPGDTTRGFIRIWDVDVMPGYRPSFDDLLSVAEYGLGANPFARGPDPLDGSQYTYTWVNLSWQPGDFAVSHDVYIGDNFDEVNEATPDSDVFRGNTTEESLWIGFPECPYPDGLTPGTTYYWRIDEVNDVNAASPWKGPVWSFWLAPETAYDPYPADGAKFQDPDVDLSWSAGLNAAMHYVYFGDDFDTVKNATGGRPRAATSYDPETLELQKVYYWRVDEVEQGGALHTGDVWRFTTTTAKTGSIVWELWEDIGGTNVDALKGDSRYPWLPTQTGEAASFTLQPNLDYYGGRMHGWLHVPVAGDYTFWVAGDDNTELWLSTDQDPANVRLIASVPVWTGLNEWSRYTSQQSEPITLDTDCYYIMGLWKEGDGGDHISAAWQGPGIPQRTIIAGGYLAPYEPLWAHAANPANGATGVSETVTLRWTAGIKAAQHDVFFGTDRDAVANADTTTAGIYRGRQNFDANDYLPTECPLPWGVTCYWRIDEVNEAEPDSPWKGSLWSFTTANCLIVEDFEQYDDVCNQIFYTWTDGWGHEGDPGCGVLPATGNGTGSTVGNLNPPTVEQTIVHGGRQSMPFGYNNGVTPFYSEASRQWASPQDWTCRDVRGLSLCFHGHPGNAPDTLYLVVQDNAAELAVVTHPDPEVLQAAGWQEWNIDLQQLSSVDLASVKKIYLGVGNRNSPQAGGSGKLYFDDIRVYPPRCVPSLAKPAADLSGNCIVDYADIQIVASQWLNDEFTVTPVDPGTAGLVARYRFEGDANDAVGDHNGVTSDIVTYGAGKVGQAIILDGVNDYVIVGSVGIGGDAPRTISGWAKAHATVMPDWTGILGFTDPGGGAAKSFDIEYTGVTGATYRGYGIHVYGWERNMLPLDLDWHHLAATYDEITVRWYGDGRLVGSSDLPLDTVDNLQIGKRADYENTFPGRIDEVRIFNRALSEAEIAWLAGHTSPLSIPADLYQDDVIDFKDLAVLADSWLDELLWP